MTKEDAFWLVSTTTYLPSHNDIHSYFFSQTLMYIIYQQHEIETHGLSPRLAFAEELTQLLTSLLLITMTYLYSTISVRALRVVFGRSRLENIQMYSKVGKNICIKHMLNGGKAILSKSICKARVDPYSQC